jgi:hypothetical protein
VISVRSCVPGQLHARPCPNTAIAMNGIQLLLLIESQAPALLFWAARLAYQLQKLSVWLS